MAKERPILMSAPMVLATIEDRKTQTRRIANAGAFHSDVYTVGIVGEIDGCAAVHLSDCAHAGLDVRCPYGRAGDRLWVKETFSAHGAFGADGRIFYRADIADGQEPHGLHWKPSIFMPRKASRMTLEITAVRCERLNTISEEDAGAEGVEEMMVGTARAHVWRDYGLKGDAHFACTSAKESYQTLWDSINGAGAWAKNPWVWVITFSRIKP